MGKHQSLTLVMIPASFQTGPAVTALWEALPSNRLKQMQIPTATHETEIRDSYGRAMGRIEGHERDGNPTGRPTESTNLDPGNSQSLSDQPESIQELERRPRHVCNGQAAQPSWALCVASGGADAPSLAET